MLFCCVYRSPSAKEVFYDSLLRECDRLLLHKHQNITILGDLNSDLLNPTSLSSKSLLRFCKHLQLTELVQAPTRITNTTASLLDVILTNKPDCFRNTKSCLCSISDHNIIATHFIPRGVKIKRDPKYVKLRKFQPLDEDLLMKLHEVDIWDEVTNFEDINDCVDCFNGVLIGLLDILFPAKWCQIRLNGQPWSQTSVLRKYRQQRDKAHKDALRYNTCETWQRYRKLRNKVTSVHRECKSKYINNLATSLKDEPSKFWRQVSYLSGKNFDDVLVDVHSAGEFNKYFLSIASDIAANLKTTTMQPLGYLTRYDAPLLSFAHVSLGDVLVLVKQLCPNKATGPDSIPAKFCKLLGSLIAYPIMKIINMSFDQCIFPALWKQANVIPLQKKKGDTSLTNYRPISVLPILSKIIERVVKQQVMDHVTQHNLLSIKQSGFRQLRMCYYMLLTHGEEQLIPRIMLVLFFWISLKHLTALIMRFYLRSYPFMALTRVSAVVEKLSYPSDTESMFTK